MVPIIAAVLATLSLICGETLHSIIFFLAFAVTILSYLLAEEKIIVAIFFLGTSISVVFFTILLEMER